MVRSEVAVTIWLSPWLMIVLGISTPPKVEVSEKVTTELLTVPV